ncbi:hypothetical protein BGZ94_005461 [Podila epigama]|nr:hypothetical protein BGZ94_005461 [Podila epigama]
MPSDPIINFTTSGAAAFCARLLVHPLHHVKASMQNMHHHSTDTRPRLPLLDRLEAYLHHHQQQHYMSRFSTGAGAGAGAGTRQLPAFPKWRGLYQGISFALVVQVPALALFLSTYDASKHSIAHLAHLLHLPCFHLHHAETHLASGAIAKAAGAMLWAPQQALQALYQGPGQLSLRSAVQLAKQQNQQHRLGQLWSQYWMSATTLMPYTAIYFAVYEKLKQCARSFSSPIHTQDTPGRRTTRTPTRHLDSREYSLQLMIDTPSPLTLGTYMVCVSGAVAISSTICHIASAIRSQVMQSTMVSLSTLSATMSTPPATVVAATASSRLAPALQPLTVVTQSNTASHSLTLHQQQHQQHTHLTTSTAPSPTTAAGASELRLHRKQQQIAITTTSSTANVISENATKRAAILRRSFRSLTRGLGLRILWTAPGVTLTTAGFEVLRNMALSRA